MSYENPYTPPTLTGFNSSPPSDDGARTAANAVRWATHLSKIGNPLKTYAQAINAAVLAAFDLIPARLYPLAEAENQANVTPTNYQYDIGDVRRYGVSGNGADETSAIQSAFNVARYGLGRVHFPSQNNNGPTVYRCNGVNVYEGTYVTADDSVIIEKSGGGGGTHIFDCISTLGSATLLTANATKAASTVTVTSASGLSAGQLVIVRDANVLFSSLGRNLELNEIASISGLTVTLRNRLIGNYATASSAELVPITTPARRIKFENVRCRLPTGTTGGGFYFESAYDWDVVNCSCSGMGDQGGVQVWRSAYGRVLGGSYVDGQNQSTPGTGYGISTGESSHHLLIKGVYTRNIRENAFGINTRFSKFVDCICVSPYDSGFNSHGNGVFDCDFINCEVYSSRQYGFIGGFGGASYHDERIRFIDCRVFDSGSFAFATSASLGAENVDIQFMRCVAVRPGVLNAAQYGFYVSRTTKPRLIDCEVWGLHDEVRAGILLEVCDDAIVRGGEIRDMTDGWGIIHEQCTGVVIEGVTFRDNLGENVHSTGVASTSVRVHDCDFDDVLNTRNAGDLWWNNYGYMSGSNSWDPGSISDGASGTRTVDVAGAQFGDQVEVSLGLTLAGLVVSGYVSSSGVVTAVLLNNSGAPVDLASTTVRAVANRRG